METRQQRRAAERRATKRQNEKPNRPAFRGARTKGKPFSRCVIVGVEEGFHTPSGRMLGNLILKQPTRGRIHRRPVSDHLLDAVWPGVDPWTRAALLGQGHG